MHYEFWEGVHRLYQPAIGTMAQQRLGTPAQGSNPVRHIPIVEATVYSEVSNSLELNWFVLVWRKGNLGRVNQVVYSQGTKLFKE